MIFILTGLKHSGKSTVAKKIAEYTGCRIYDIDNVIQAHSGKSAREVFQQNGAAGFRSAELDACKKVAAECALLFQPGTGQTTCSIQDTTMKQTNKTVSAVIATGGGICDNPEALATLAVVGTVVFLDASFNIVWERIEASAQKTGEYPAYLKSDNPRTEFAKIFEERRRIYLQNSEKTIDIKGMNDAEDVARTICH